MLCFALRLVFSLTFFECPQPISSLPDLEFSHLFLVLPSVHEVFQFCLCVLLLFHLLCCNLVVLSFSGSTFININFFRTACLLACYPSGPPALSELDSSSINSPVNTQNFLTSIRQDSLKCRFSFYRSSTSTFLSTQLFVGG